MAELATLERYAKPYPRPRLKEMKAVGWWVELGIHRGLIAEQAVKRSGIDGPVELIVQYYNLGPDEGCIGVLDNEGRRAFFKSALASRPWYDEWDLSSKDGPLQGPALVERMKGTATGSRLKKVARDAIAKIKEGLNKKPSLGEVKKGKPTLSRGKPALTPPRIAYEDRPDVGYPKSKPFLAVRLTKPTLKIKSKPLFRLKGDPE